MGFFFFWCILFCSAPAHFAVLNAWISVEGKNQENMKRKNFSKSAWMECRHILVHWDIFVKEFIIIIIIFFWNIWSALQQQG